VRAWAVATERREGNVDEAGIHCVQVDKVEAETGETSGRFSFNKEVCAGGKFFELSSAVRRVEIKIHSLFAAVVPPVKKTAVLAGLAAHHRPRRTVPNSHNIGPGFGQQFGGETSGIVGKVKYA
jgi:hypothetical protein